MYNAVPEQTNEDNLITASGTKVSKITAACPEWIEFGTWIKVEGKQYRCEDLMNKRYRSGSYFDLISDSYEEAKEWGRKKLLVELIK